MTWSAVCDCWVSEALKAIVSRHSPVDQRRLFHDNAVSFYGLA